MDTPDIVAYMKEKKEHNQNIFKEKPKEKPKGMNNNLNSLNNYLFEELERLNDDEELQNEENLNKELKRAKAIAGVSSAIVNNAKLILDAKKYADEMGITNENEVLKLSESHEKMD